MEEERRINWLGLFIKMIILFVFVIIIVWLISKIVSKNKLSKTFINNINNMETVAVSYFKEIDLPLNKGDSIKVTLGELIDKKLITTDNSTAEETCDSKNSYAKITREKNNYTVETTLKCGKEKDTKTKKFSLNDCRNCNASKNKNNESKKENSKDANNTTTENTNNITYYEYVKETTSYSNWVKGNITGYNIENKYEYYGIENETYYTLGIIPSNTNDMSYTIKLDKVPNNKYYFTEVEESSYYNDNDENKYLNNQNSSLYNGNNINTPKKIDEYTLGENNFTYKLSPYYRKGTFYIDITINITNTNNAKAYFDTKTKTNVYFIPLKVNIKFISDQVSASKPSGNYETISYYRYVETNKETIWRTENYVEGYTKTGNTKTN